MNVNEFAEQVVFGTTLEDKLLVPGRLTHATTRSKLPSVGSLAVPGRPPGLQMRHGRVGNLQPPSDDKLENEQARGQLLHFLANHELLATELMALTLLKFPDAPRAFRQGILVTLQEEQEHTRMYIRRMQECGVEFGSYPVSGQFWRMIEPMQSPMDFVSRLSLTFEQANLDYSLHFASVFRNLGDIATADVLQKIYTDEIGHVQHGLHWFRQWKNPEQTDWEAYQSSLEFPMSPQRGRGPRGAFNRAGRVAAGLTDDFIEAMEVFRQSRGRVPRIHWFDAAAEAELAGERSPKADQLMEQLGQDLELVMLPMARQDDVVLVRRMPSREIRKQLIDHGFELPEFILCSQRLNLVERKLYGFSPWAWTPKNYDVAQPLIASAFHAPQPWHEDWRELYRKSWGAQRLLEWLSESDRRDERPDWFTSPDCAGIPVNDLGAVSSALSELAERGYTTAIVKQDLATSGRGQRRIDCRQALSAQDEAWLQWLFRSVSNQGGSEQAVELPLRLPVCVIEPELDRLVDLSFLWHLPRDSQTPDYLGWTRPLVTAGRRFAGTRLGSALAGCDVRLKRFVLADRCARLKAVVDWLQPRIAKELAARNFSGYFGVDALVCQDERGELKIKPLVELNPRTTMGHVALSLEKRLAPGTEAEFRIFTKSEWDAVHLELTALPFAKTRDGLWKTGVLWLGEVDDNTKLIPALLVGDAVQHLDPGHGRFT